MIYISKVFNKIAEFNPKITSLFFVYNLEFIAFAYLVKDFIKAFEKVTKIVLEQGKYNAITYNITKTKALFFSKLHC